MLSDGDRPRASFIYLVFRFCPSGAEAWRHSPPGQAASLPLQPQQPVPEHACQNADAEAAGNHFDSNADAGNCGQNRPADETDGELRPIVPVLLQRFPPEKDAEEEAEKHRRRNQRSHDDKDQHERRTHADSRDKQNDAGKRQGGKDRKADAESLGKGAEGFTGIIGIHLLPKGCEPEEEVGNQQQADQFENGGFQLCQNGR